MYVGTIDNFIFLLLYSALFNFQIDLIDMMILNTRLKVITKTNLHISVDKYLHNTTNYVNCFHKEITRFIRYGLLKGFGTCTSLPYAYNKVEWICDYGLELLVCM